MALERIQDEGIKHKIPFYSEEEKKITIKSEKINLIRKTKKKNARKKTRRKRKPSLKRKAMRYHNDMTGTLLNAKHDGLITSTEYSVVSVLISHASEKKFRSGDDRYCYPKVETIAITIKRSVSTVHRTLKSLKEKGYVSVKHWVCGVHEDEKRGKHVKRRNSYRVHLWENYINGEGQFERDPQEVTHQAKQRNKLEEKTSQIGITKKKKGEKTEGEREEKRAYAVNANKKTYKHDPIMKFKLMAVYNYKSLEVDVMTPEQVSREYLQATENRTT